jgi:indoleamine 2,3-dioxygenase
VSIPVGMSEGSELLKPTYARRGFLPDADPLAAFPEGSPYAALDEIGRDLPSLLYDRGFRAYARTLDIPKWEAPLSAETLPQLRLYYVRVGFLASAYVNQVGEERVQMKNV